MTILIIEGDPTDVDLLKLALQRAGIPNPVQVVANGKEAINYLRAEEPYSDRNRFPFPTIIFSDIKMPGIDGFGVLDWLKRHPECSVIPLIMLSNSGHDADIKRAYEQGANAYLVKPDSLRDLQEMVKAAFAFWQWCAKPQSPVKC